jgi:hypothetical protein
MNTRKTAELPAELQSTQRRFEQWRQTCDVRTRIPDSLWAAAVKLAGRYGICRTAKALRLGYYSLKERVENETAFSASSSPTVREATFLELVAPARTPSGECLLEWEGAAGAKMRVHLKGVDVPDLVALSRSFWEAQR